MLFGISLILRGMLMGIAELLPGISSGTIAFVVGIYEDLFDAIRKINHTSLALVLKGRFRAFSQVVPVKFLSQLLLGMLISFFLFSHLIHWSLTDPFARSYVQALFLGLVLASLHFCIKQVPHWNGVRFILFAVITLLTALFVLTSRAPQGLEQEVTSLDFSLAFKIFLAGVVAVFAMLLPGISGSYLLHIMGFYTLVIASVKDFTGALLVGEFSLLSFMLLGSLGLGMLAGIGLFARLISYFLKHFKSTTLSILCGVMVGALPTLWPFWKWTAQSLENSEAILIPEKAYLPSLVSLEFGLPLSFFIMGFLGFILLEKWMQSLPSKA